MTRMLPQHTAAVADSEPIDTRQWVAAVARLRQDDPETALRAAAQALLHTNSNGFASLESRKALTALQGLLLTDLATGRGATAKRAQRSWSSPHSPTHQHVTRVLALSVSWWACHRRLAAWALRTKSVLPRHAILLLAPPARRTFTLT
jgi:hypothetical protein